VTRNDRSSRRSNDPGQSPAPAQDSASEILGRSKAIQDLRERVAVFARSDDPVLITGESGAGKELVARALHRGSRRSLGPFVAMNCPALAVGLAESDLFGHIKGAYTSADHDRRGLFERAHGGTLFLDEIGDLNQEIQAKLLRVLQEGEIDKLGSEHSKTVDVRVVCATHRDLRNMVAEGRFRADLFYRISVLKIDVPSLRARGEDIRELAERFLVDPDPWALGTPRSLSPAAVAKLNEYHWPGNVRELQNVIKRAKVMARAGRIEAEHIELDAIKAMQEGCSDSKEKTEADEGILGQYVRSLPDIDTKSRRFTRAVVLIAEEVAATHARKIETNGAESASLTLLGSAGESRGRLEVPEEWPLIELLAYALAGVIQWDLDVNYNREEATREVLKRRYRSTFAKTTDLPPLLGRIAALVLPPSPCLPRTSDGTDPSW
jgi:transcriptional regulator with GAF, ATPase, and Fis domain